jgi:hypothetical protein
MRRVLHRMFACNSGVYDNGENASRLKAGSEILR